MGRLFGILSGIASILGFGISIALSYSAIRSDIATEFKEIIILLSSSMTVLLFTVVIIFFYYFNKVDNLKDLPKENLSLKSALKRNEILVKNTAEYYHNIAHYYRNLLLVVEETLNSPDDRRIKSILELFDTFLNTLTANLHSFLTLFTGDNCAITIKIVKENSNNKCLVKTFYRDPISYRKRKRSDYLPNADIKIYDIEDNTAFKVISSPKWRNTTYLCDDLKTQWEKGEYENKTNAWMNLYNATAVVPIAKRIGATSRKILGFICVDNFAGNLANTTVENFLSSMADMLYPLFEKYETIAKLSQEKGIFNERAKAFTDWNYR